MNLFTIHNVAASGGSICSQAISAYTNSLLISEVNPLGSLIRKKNPFKPFKGFQPGRILDKALMASQSDLDLELRAKYFSYQLQISILHAEKQGKNLALREHTHSTFPFKQKSNKLDIIEFLNNQHDLKNLSLKIEIFRPILTIRHPLDNFISARKKDWHTNYCNGSLDSYCKAILKMQKYFMHTRNAIILRYEDLCFAPHLFYEKLAEGLGIEKSAIPTQDSINNIAVTGKSGRKTSNISIRPRQVDFIDSELKHGIKESNAYIEFCKINGYNNEINAHPI